MNKSSPDSSKKEIVTEGGDSQKNASPSRNRLFGRKVSDELVEIGHNFKNAREKQSLSIREIATRLKIKEEYLRALEEDNYDNLPSNTFVIGYVRSYAKVLGINSTELLNDLSVILSRRHKDHFPEMNAVEPAIYKENWLVWGGAFILAILVLMSVLWWLEDNGESEDGITINQGDAMLEQLYSDDPSHEPVTNGQNSPPTPIQEAGSDSAEPLAQGRTQQTSQEPAHRKTSGQEMSQNEKKGNKKESDLNHSAQYRRLPAYQGNLIKKIPTDLGRGNDQLWVEFDRECWIEVTDVEGAVIHTNLHSGNSELKLHTSGPLSVVLGDASAVKKITYNNKEIALDANSVLGRKRRTSNQVARVHLN